MPRSRNNDGSGPSPGRGSPPSKRRRSSPAQSYSKNGAVVLYKLWQIAGANVSQSCEVAKFAAKVREEVKKIREYPITTGNVIGGREAIYLDAPQFQKDSRDDFFAKFQDTLIRISGTRETSRKVTLCGSIVNGIRERVLKLAKEFTSNFYAFKEVHEVTILKEIHASCFSGLLQTPCARKLVKGSKSKKSAPNYFTLCLPRTDAWLKEYHDLLDSASIPIPEVVPVDGCYLLQGTPEREQGKAEELAMLTGSSRTSFNPFLDQDDHTEEGFIYFHFCSTSYFVALCLNSWILY